MEIRRAQAADADRILELLGQVAGVHRAIRPDLFVGKTKYSREDLLSLLENPERPVFVAVEEDLVVGYAFLWFEERHGGVLAPGTELYLDDLCVDEKWRHKKVASALFGHVCEYGRNMGCAELTLNVWTGNDGALAFYEKMGMKPQKVKMELPL
ncbi:MAG: GNAT family N-acetyltransferase [Clostridia bacterium]|nr:GNAT family N-acetyltransferase [Clostridia bacterium]